MHSSRMRTVRLLIVPWGRCCPEGLREVLSRGEGGVFQGGVVRGREVLSKEGGGRCCQGEVLSRGEGGVVQGGGRCCPGGREVLSRGEGGVVQGGDVVRGGGRCCDQGEVLSTPPLHQPGHNTFPL